VSQPEAQFGVGQVDPGYFRMRRPGRADLARRSAMVASVVPAAALPLLLGGDPRKLSRRDLGRAFRVVAQRLGGSWVKVGQLLASAPGLVGEDLAEELRPLLDASPPVSIQRVRGLISRSLGRPAGELFAAIDPQPIGTGSLAVVHRGVTDAGREVAVKVLRPGIERDTAADLVLIETLLDRFAAWRGIERSVFRGLVGGLRQQLTEELDLRREAVHMDRFRALFAQAGLSRMVIPEVELELSARRVLTMEFLDGVAIDDLSAIEAMGGDPAPLVAEAVRAWWATVAVAGMFHGDVHAGNLMYTADDRLGLIDWGIVGRLSAENRRLMLALLAGAAGQESAWDDAVEILLATVPERVRLRDDFDPDRARSMARRGLSYALTRPYGEVSLGALLSGDAFDDGGERPASRPPRRRGPAGRRATNGVANGPGPGADEPPGPDRDILLLGKQLLYFERYGKQYLADRSVLSDAGLVLDLVRQSGDGSPGGGW
jgi:predicted unusual protein kinase regulating ubiquinone biosynthesis (AarF/ABC1/UbiB family)